MKEKIRRLGKGLKRMIDERVEAVRDYISSRSNRIVLGFIILGLGLGLGGSLIISGYIPMPE